MTVYMLHSDTENQVKLLITMEQNVESDLLAPTHSHGTQLNDTNVLTMHNDWEGQKYMLNKTIGDSTLTLLKLCSDQDLNHVKVASSQTNNILSNVKLDTKGHYDWSETLLMATSIKRYHQISELSVRVLLPTLY